MSAATDSPTTDSDQALHSPWLYRLSVGSLIALMLLCIAWEWFLAPLRPGGSWLIIKFLPLLLPLRGVLTRNRYTMQWSSMLILLFFTEGIVRATSDRGFSATLAWVEVALTLVFFTSTILYLRPYKRRARAAAKAAPQKR
ncbi:hypothetical protein D3C72_1468840 [compost metagenome]